MVRTRPRGRSCYKKSYVTCIFVLQVFTVTFDCEDANCLLLGDGKAPCLVLRGYVNDISGVFKWRGPSLVLPSSTYLFTAGVEGFYFHLITLRHTPQSVGLLWVRDRPVAETSTWQHKHCTRQTSMPPVGFEPTIPAIAGPQT
jgi:hypothetical protein